MDSNVFKHKPQLLIEQYTGKHLFYDEKSPAFTMAGDSCNTEKSNFNYNAVVTSLFSHENKARSLGGKRFNGSNK